MAWNGADGGARGAGGTVRGRTRGAGRRRIGLWAALLVAAACATLGVSRWLSGGGTAGGPAPSERRPSALRAHAPSARGAEPPTAGCAAPAHGGKRLWNGIGVVSSSVRTNANGTVVESLVLEDGRRAESVRPAPPAFANASDQLIALLLSARPGESPPPLPDLASADRDFADSLKTPVEILETDGPEVRELKAAVMEARAYLAERVRGGETVASALAAHRREMEGAADRRLTAVREMRRLAAEAGADAAAEFADRVNESFRARGIPEIPRASE